MIDTSPTTSQPKTILVIEDEQLLINALTKRLTDAGYKISVARDGEEGLQKALTEKPDLLLVDIVLPKMDGITMLSKIRQDPWGKSVKAIILSNLSDEAKVADALSQGVRDYLVKTDWKLEDIVKKVKEKLGGNN